MGAVLFHKTRTVTMLFLVIHPIDPQSRLIKQAALIVQQGGVIVYPTDSAYAIGCQLENKSALERIRNIRHLNPEHNFTLICRDLSEISTYATLDNPTFKLLKANTPGPFTFILKASSEVPRRLLHPKRKTIGLRIPDSPIIQALLAELREPLMSLSLILPDEELIEDAYGIENKIGNEVDLIIDGGPCDTRFTTIVNLVDGPPTILREGKGELNW